MESITQILFFPFETFDYFMKNISSFLFDGSKKSQKSQDRAMFTAVLHPLFF